MKRSTIKFIVFLATVLIFGLVITQIFWVGKAWQLQKDRFDHDVTDALRKVALEILRHQGDSALMTEPVKKLSEDYFVVSINDTLHPDYLRSLLTGAFNNAGIKTPFEYSIYDCFNDSVVFVGSVAMSVGKEIPDVPQPKIDWDRNGHYFGVYFPAETGYLSSRMSFWIISSIVLLAVVVFFAYVISVIFRQKRLSEIRNDFINNMTHELKTPISTISLASEVLMRPDIKSNPDRLSQYAQTIYNENDRLKTQVERVLQLSTLDKGLMKLKKQKMDLIPLLEDCVKRTLSSTELPENAVVFEHNIEKAIIYGNPDHLGNVFVNLLDNALKYSHPQPQVLIRIQLKNSRYAVSIRDSGIGIPKAYINRIFDRFFRVPKGNVHDVKGFGLGLHYVKTMVDAHDGLIDVSSVEGKGSIFTVYLKMIQE